MFRSCALAILLTGFAAAAPLGSAAEAMPGNGLVTYRAVYDLQLKQATDRSGISGMYGRIVYEFGGSACDGYTTRFRLVTQVRSASGSRMTDQQMTSYENLATRTFRFATRSFTDNNLDSDVRGAAHGNANGITVDLEKPKPAHFTLPQAKFPTEHMLAVIHHAEAGDTLYQSRVFDGSADAVDQSVPTTTVIGLLQKPKPSDMEAKKAGKFAGDPFWPVSVAYFKDKAKGDQVPEYRLDFKLYANGITRDLTMDYGDFVLIGKLVRLDLLKQPSCGQ